MKTDWLRRSGWRASVTSGLAAVLAAALVSGSRDPVVDVLAGAQGGAGSPTSGTPPVSPPSGPHLPWPHARSAEPPASISRRTTPAALVDVQEIPAVALVAYQRAAVVIDAADPSCRLDWALLAAIGRVESDHGRFGGSSLDAQGVDHPAVLGPRLDGRHGTALIRDTDAGRLDHDRRYDRAVGPMQFLPATWSVVAVDGDGDGRRNVQDIDDASLGAAVYLCAGQDDLSTVAGQRAAVYRYNHSSAYVADVLAIARAYRSGSPFLGPTTTPVVTTQPTRAARPEPVVSSGPSPAQPTRSSTATPSEPTTAPTTRPTTGPSEPPTPSVSPTDTPTATPTTTPTATPTESPSSSPTGPTDGPSESPSPSPTGPTDGPSESPSPSPTGPTESPSPSPTGPTDEPTATASPTEPPVIPEVRPVALAGLSAHRVAVIDEAWPVCRDRLPLAWTRLARTRLAMVRCLARETGIPRHNADLVAFVHWLARHEADTTAGR